jgi:hypothetical protein
MGKSTDNLRKSGTGTNCAPIIAAFPETAMKAQFDPVPALLAPEFARLAFQLFLNGACSA